MATNTAPLLSFGAKGQLAKSMVYSTWKGRAYTRRYVIPANPNSSEQQKTRGSFSWLNAVWKVSPTLFQDPWTAFAKGKVLTNRNALIRSNLPVLRGMTDNDDMIFSPGSGGGLPYTSVTPTPGAGTLSLLCDAPDLPPAWTALNFNVAAAIREQDPDSGTLYGIVAVSEAGGTLTIPFTGLAAGVWVWGAWPVWQKSALATDLAYGPSVTGKSTVT